MRLASVFAVLTGSVLLTAAGSAQALILSLGLETLVQANGVDLQVSGYSVPCCADWNGDGLADLLVGEGGGTLAGTVHLFVNSGTPGSPVFGASSHLQAAGQDLSVPGEGCLGAFPRVALWNGDLLPDLLVGSANGTVTLFLNEGAPGSPQLGLGQLVQVGPAGSKVAIDVGARATPIFEDWNADGRRDLVVGALDGKLHLFLNAGSEGAPDFPAESFAQGAAGDLVVASGRSSPVLADFDEDGRPDLLTGNTNGEILFFANVGTAATPLFGDYLRVAAAGVPIDYAGTPRTRPFLCDWTGDGWLDLLVGLGDGKVHLLQGAATDVATLPPAARLGLPWPNPANPRLSVELAVDRPGTYAVRVLALDGRALATLFAGSAVSGTLRLDWDGRDGAGRPAPSGVYLIALSGEATGARKCLLLR